MAKASAPAGDVISEETSDGRVRRGTRNHELIVQAVYDLVRESSELPSVATIAARAGVGERTVFRQFQDLDTLYRSLAERLLQEIVADIGAVHFTGELDADLAAIVARRARIFERMLPFRRVGRVAWAESQVLHERAAAMAQLFRLALERAVMVHLPPAEDTLEALDALLSAETWDRLRDRQRLSTRRAEQVLLGSARALVAALTTTATTTTTTTAAAGRKRRR